MTQMIKYNEYEVGGYIYDNLIDKVHKIKSIVVWMQKNNSDIVYFVLNEGNEATMPSDSEKLRKTYPYLGKNWNTLRLLYDRKTKT